MSTAIQRRGDTTAAHETFTGLARELTVDTDKNTVVVHDGVTAGGHPLVGENALVNNTTTLATNRAAGSQIMALTNNVNRLTYLSQQGGMAVDYTVLANEFIKAFDLPVDIDPELAVAIGVNAVGYPVAGGFYAGLIDTIKGDIIAADAYQTGERYALIVSPKSLEGGRGTATGDLRWFTSNTGDANGADTRWNGLEATNSILALEDPDFEAHGHIADVRSSDPAPATPGGSDWYMPAMDELELLYRNLKPNNADNFTTPQDGRTFPGGTETQGSNPSSDPVGIDYENGPRIPDVTFLNPFKQSAAESLSQLRYWSTTWASTDRAWRQGFSTAGAEGRQTTSFKTVTDRSVRPVRRVVL